MGKLELIEPVGDMQVPVIISSINGDESLRYRNMKLLKDGLAGDRLSSAGSPDIFHKEGLENSETQ